MGWYHWECVQVTEEPVGTWLCPSCSPNAAFYVKQLVKGPAGQPPNPNSGKAATKLSSKNKEPVQKPRKSATKAKEPMPSPKHFGGPLRSEMQERNTDTRKPQVANKGIAVKKPAPEKPKPKWVGWIELASDDEEQFKEKVEAQWRVEEGLSGKRTRASKSVAEANETGSRKRRASSRAEGKKQVVKTDPVEEEEGDEWDDAVYQEKEDKEEDPVSDEGSTHKEASEDEETSGNEDVSMDEGETTPEENSEEEHSANDQESVSQEDCEDSMDVDIDDDTEKVDNNSAESSSDVFFSAEEEITAPLAHTNEHSDSELSDPPSDIDEENPASGIQTPTSPTTPTPTQDRLLDETAAPQGDASPASHFSEDMDVDEGDQGQQEEVVVTANPAAVSDDVAARYQRGYVWVEYPESAIRSTLPRLA